MRAVRSVLRSRILLIVLAMLCLGEIGALIAHHLRQSPGAIEPPRVTQPAQVPATEIPTGLIAAIVRTTMSYLSPSGPTERPIAPTWHGSPVFVPVAAVRAEDLEVRLPTRPNGSTAWIRRAGVPLSRTPYRIVINLGTRHLYLYRNSTLVLDAPAGIGTVADPTPTGHFFVAFFAKAPSPAWGPFVLVTSAHSDAISDWEESGDALVAIHGPLGDNAAIGTDGARISHGCIRLHDSDLVQLRVVPDGSPIDIVS
jgi:lipoprotein-anchoring transpeptidase ErfK/SrfK